MTEVNVPLLRKAVEWVEEQAGLPEDKREWDQGFWMAFHVDDTHRDPIYLRPTVAQAYAEQAQAGSCGTVYCVAGWIGQELDNDYKYTWKPEGKPMVDDFAADALGLTDDQADELFDADNTAADVREIAERIAGEKL